MSRRTKFFIGLLVAALVVAAAVSGDPKFLLIIPVLLFVAWLVWRVFVFVWQLAAPVRAAAKPLDDHLKSTLSQAGLGKVVEMTERIDRGIDRAVSVTQQGIDARRNP